MNKIELKSRLAVAFAFAFTPVMASAFTSASTGVDGPFSPTVNQTVTLPSSGILNYTTISIPLGVTIKFTKNTINTPIVLLATEDVTIAGTIDISGSNAAAVGVAGDGNQGDDGTPGAGGPGGFGGGRGGAAGTITPGTSSNPTPSNIAGSGLGPGGGSGGVAFQNNGGIPCITGSNAQASIGGAGGGFSNTAVSSVGTAACGGFTYFSTGTPGGTGYGSSLLQPLIGGSGGGGGGGGTAYAGGGGGGGGGAILIASSGTINLNGAILANGGAGGNIAGAGVGAAGGGGSGGAIRLIANQISGGGMMSAAPGVRGVSGSGVTNVIINATDGAPGRIRVEADIIKLSSNTNPPYLTSSPNAVFLSSAPALAITSIVTTSNTPQLTYPAPESPTGNADIALPSTTINPVTVRVTSTNVPVGNTVKLTVVPANGLSTAIISGALAGSDESAIADVSVTLPAGPSVLQAQTTYTITASLGDELSRYANNERVEKVMLTAALGKQPAKITLITISGKEFEAPTEAVRLIASGG